MRETTASLRRIEGTRAGSIEARHLVRRFGEVRALDDVTLEVAPGEFFSLLGPSGCGKTTLLRILAGLDQADLGEVFIGGRNMASVPAHRRPVNTVFQSYALFPHLDVWHNVAFGLRMKKVPSAELARRVNETLELVRLSELARRKPHQLSGGQKQRAALARAIVNEPEVLLLDEPLAALDVKLRRDLQSELHALQRRLGITFLHVTHDQDEALSLSDRLAVMNAGRIVQCGTPEEVYARPRNRFVAQFIGGCNLIEATLLKSNGSSAHIRTALGNLQLNAPVTKPSFTVAIRPERLRIGAGANEGNSFQGEVVEASFTGPETLLRLRCGETLLKAAMPNASSVAHARAGEIVTIHLPPEALMVLED